jgi:hypothetical protein
LNASLATEILELISHVHPVSFVIILSKYISIYVLLTTHPLLVPRSWKSRAIPLPTLWATPGL